MLQKMKSHIYGEHVSCLLYNVDERPVMNLFQEKILKFHEAIEIT
jgi:hypothetical protein